MSIQPVRRLLSVAEYHRMSEVGILTEDDRVELIQGEIIKMSPIGSKHSGHVNRVNTLFNQRLGGHAIISVQNPVYLNDFSEPETDITILKLKDDFYTSHHPKPDDILLVIEVADTSVNYDREVKLPLYALAGIPEFWIIDLEHSQIEVFQIPRHGSYARRETFFKEDTISLVAFDIEILVADIFLNK